MENIPERQERLQSRTKFGGSGVIEANAFGAVIQKATVHRHGWLRLNTDSLILAEPLDMNARIQKAVSYE